MTTLYTIELTHTDGRPSLWAMPRPQGWSPACGGQASVFPEQAGWFDQQGVAEWLEATRLTGGFGFRANVRVVQARGAVA